MWVDDVIVLAMESKSEQKRERLRRSEAAVYARDRLGQTVTTHTLRTWPVPYKVLGRDAVYEVSDLDRFIEARLAGAAVRLPQRKGLPAQSKEQI
jgi:hypothetical protein